MFFKNENSIGLKPARHIFVDDVIYCPSFSEFKDSDDIYNWSSNKLSNFSLKEIAITKVYEYQHPKIIYFNNDNATKFSLEQPILIKRNNKIEFLTTAMVKEGDILFRYYPTDNLLNEFAVTSITIQEGTFSTYNFYAEPSNLLFANGLIIGTK